MGVIGILSGAHLVDVRNNISGGSLIYSTSGLPNAQTSAYIRGNTASIASGLSRPWEVSASEFMIHILASSSVNSGRNDLRYFGWGSGGTLLGRISFEDFTAKATIFINNVKVATAVLASYAPSTWTTFHIHVKLGGAGVGFIKFYKDGLFGSPIVEDITTDTDPTSAITADEFKFSLTADTPLASVVCIDPNDGQAPVTLDEIGTLGVLSRMPIADSATNTDWTPDSGGTGYTQIDEIPNNDADYVEAAAVGDRSTFTHEATVGAGIKVLAVRYSARIQRVGTAAGANISITRRRSATDYDETSQGAPTDGDIEKIFHTEPVASAELTPANVDDTEWGAVTVT